MNVSLNATLNENQALLGHFGRFFLAHGAPQNVSVSQRISRQLLGNLHDLFLVQDDAVGGLENILEFFMGIGDRRASMLAVDVIADHPRFQRTRTKQGDQGHDFVKAVRYKPANQVFHAAGFQLENSGGLAGLQQAESGLIGHRQLLNVDGRFAVLSALLVDDIERPVNDGECSQAEEVEFDQADGFDIVLVKLSDQAAAARFAKQRCEIGQGGGGDDHAARMPASVSRQALQRSGQVEDGARVFFLVVAAFELFFLLQRLVQRHAQFQRYQLGDAVDESISVPQHAAAVAHHGLGGHGAVGNDLADLVTAIVFRDVVDDLVAFFHAKVDIEVRHGNTLGIQEALEQKIILQRVETGNIQRPGHQRPGAGAAARPDRNTVAFGPAYKVRNNQEIAGKAHGIDDIQFHGQAVVVILPGKFSRGPV